MRLPHSRDNLIPGLYFYFLPNEIRPIELVTKESLALVFLRSQEELRAPIRVM